MTEALKILLNMSYNPAQRLGGLSMAGKIRTREKCSQCGKPFRIIEEADILCPACNTRPKTFYIFLYWQGKHRIPRDLNGYILDSYKRAHRLLENIRKDIDDGIFNIANYLPKEIEQFRCKNLLPKWKDAKAKTGLSPSYLRDLRRFQAVYYLPFWGEKDARRVISGDVEDFYCQLPAHLSEKTKKNILTTLHNFFTWLYRREAIRKIPVFPVISPPDPVITVINKDAQLKILDCLHPRHKPIFSFMMLHPVRMGEARALRVKDFNMEDITVHIHRAFSLKEERARKNKKDYRLPVNERFDTDCLKDKLPEAYAFVNRSGRPYSGEGLRKLWHKARIKAGVPHIKLYNATRHSFATNALREGHSLNKISKALGHSDSRMVERYAKHDVELLRDMFAGNVIPLGSQMVQKGKK